jgi:hypothetical protein
MKTACQFPLGTPLTFKPETRLAIWALADELAATGGPYSWLDLAPLVLDPINIRDKDAGAEISRLIAENGYDRVEASAAVCLRFARLGRIHRFRARTSKPHLVLLSRNLRRQVPQHSARRHKSIHP